MDSLFVRLPLLRDGRLAESVLVAGGCVLIPAYIVTVVIPGDANVILISIFATIGLLSLRYPIILLTALVVASQFFNDIERVKRLQLLGSLGSYDILLVILVTLLFARVVLGEKLYLSHHSYLPAIFFLLAVYFIEAFYLYDGIELLNFLKITVMIVGVYLGFYQFIRGEKEVAKIIVVFLGIYAAHGAYAVIQSMVFDLNWLDASVLFLRLEGPSTGSGEQYYLTRKVGFFYRGNSLGKGMVMMVLLAIAFRGFILKNIIMAVPIISLFIVSCVMSLTRQAIVGLVASSIFGFLLKKEARKPLLLGFALVLMLLGFGALRSHVYLDRMLTYAAISSYSSAMADKSMQSRFDVWQGVWEGEIRGPELNRRGRAADSAYISVLANSGIAGISGLLIFFVLSTLRAWRSRNAKGARGGSHLFVLLAITAVAMFSIVSNAVAGHGITPVLMFMGIADKLGFLATRSHNTGI